MSLDVNVDIYPLKARSGACCPRPWPVLTSIISQSNDKFKFVLSSTLAEDGTPDDGTFDQARVAAPFTLRRQEWCNRLTCTHRA